MTEGLPRSKHSESVLRFAFVDAHQTIMVPVAPVHPILQKASRLFPMLVARMKMVFEVGGSARSNWSIGAQSRAVTHKANFMNFAELMAYDTSGHVLRVL